MPSFGKSRPGFILAAGWVCLGAAALYWWIIVGVDATFWQILEAGSATVIGLLLLIGGFEASRTGRDRHGGDRS